MNFVKKYHLQDALDHLIKRYGRDWDIEAKNDDPDFAIVKNFRNAIELRDKQRRTAYETKVYYDDSAVVMYDTVTKQTMVFNKTKDIANLLKITTTRVNQAVREQRMIRHRFKFKRQPQYLEDGGF